MPTVRLKPPKLLPPHSPSSLPLQGGGGGEGEARVGGVSAARQAGELAQQRGPSERCPLRLFAAASPAHPSQFQGPPTGLGEERIDTTGSPSVGAGRRWGRVGWGGGGGRGGGGDRRWEGLWQGWVRGGSCGSHASRGATLGAATMCSAALGRGQEQRAEGWRHSGKRSTHSMAQRARCTPPRSAPVSTHELAAREPDDLLPEYHLRQHGRGWEGGLERGAGREAPAGQAAAAPRPVAQPGGKLSCAPAAAACAVVRT